MRTAGLSQKSITHSIAKAAQSKSRSRRMTNMIVVQALNDKGAVIGAFDTIRPWKAQQKAEVWANVGSVSAVHVRGLSRAPRPVAQTTARIYWISSQSGD